jgi:phosphopentomutase
MFSEKPSCIPELKSLVGNLSDRDITLKACFGKIKKIINKRGITDKEKVKQIKETLNGSK